MLKTILYLYFAMPKISPFTGIVLVSTVWFLFLTVLFGYFMIGTNVTRERKSDFYVIQYSNSPDLIKEHESHVESVKRWSKKYNHNYQLIVTAGKDGYERKVEAIYNTTLRIPENRWVVFLDYDIMVCNMKAADLLAIDLSGCSFVAQDSNHTANTGFVLVRNDAKGRQLVKKWYEETETCAWLYDQGALTNLILKKAYKSKYRKYTKSCCNLRGRNYQKNQCYKERMENLGYPLNTRRFDGICLLADTQRWNMHDSGQTYKRGDAFHHSHESASCEE